MKFRREWSLANPDTLSIPVIGEWVKHYVSKSEVSVDPFARNCRIADYRNDLNPDTDAESHLDALEFLLALAEQEIQIDLCIFDPPYSRNQVKRSYEGVGRSYGQKDSQSHTSNWKLERDALDSILAPGGVVLSFGWNSNGMTKGRGYDLEDVLLVAHGGASNDTICIAERKRIVDHPEFPGI